jgi:hypothetical protein
MLFPVLIIYRGGSMDKIAGLMMAVVLLSSIGAGVMMFLTPTRERGPIDVSLR